MIHQKGEEMKKKIAVLAVVVALTTTAGWAEGTTALASPEAKKEATVPVKLTTRSYQLKKVKNKEGKWITKWMPVTRVVPGDTIRFVTTVENKNTVPIEKVRIVNPVDPHLSYIARSAKCAGTCTIRFSVDGGKHFDTPERLVVMDKKGKKRRARPADYNAIEWVIDRIDGNQTSSVEFKAAQVGLRSPTPEKSA